MIAFFALVLVLSIPLWVIGALRPVEILPGLPLGSLAVVVPLIWGPSTPTRLSGN